MTGKLPNSVCARAHHPLRIPGVRAHTRTPVCERTQTSARTHTPPAARYGLRVRSLPSDVPPVLRLRKLFEVRKRVCDFDAEDITELPAAAELEDRS